MSLLLSKYDMLVHYSRLCFRVRKMMVISNLSQHALGKGAEKHPGQAMHLSQYSHTDSQSFQCKLQPCVYTKWKQTTFPHLSFPSGVIVDSAAKKTTGCLFSFPRSCNYQQNRTKGSLCIHFDSLMEM